MKKYRLGVVGAGARGETFARNLYQGSDRTELFGICDCDADRLKKFCDYCELRNARQWTDTAAFVREPGLDGIIITVPEFAHREVAVAAMRAGKHVYLEKPLAHTLADCHEIIRVQRETGQVAFVGFNMRAGAAQQKLHEIVQSGVLGQLVHVAGYEQLHVAHGASFMRRFHRYRRQSGGLLNQKCVHDLDFILWAIGHQHRITRLASFGGCNVFTPDKQPAKHCHECPQQSTCPYRARAGFVFPVGGKVPIYHRDEAVYGGDLCVYSPDKDVVDNQTIIFEFENGLRGEFCFEMFQHVGRRRQTFWGEKGMLEYDNAQDPALKLTTTQGDTTVWSFAPRQGGHGGTDPSMVGRFVAAMDRGDAGDSSLAAGLAASIVAIKAEEARLAGQVLTIGPEEYA